MVVFGDDPTNKGKAQTFTQQMKDVGIEIRIDQHADSEFATIWATGTTIFPSVGYSVSADATEGTKQFYYSENNEGIGSKEIDALIDAMTLIEDDKNVTSPATRLRRSTWRSSPSWAPLRTVLTL